MFIQVSIKKNKNDDVMTININAIQQIYPSNLGTVIVFRGSSKKGNDKNYCDGGVLSNFRQNF